MIIANGHIIIKGRAIRFEEADGMLKLERTGSTPSDRKLLTTMVRERFMGNINGSQSWIWLSNNREQNTLEYISAKIESVHPILTVARETAN